MIGRRSHRPYRPPQLLTGHIDDFPLVPETPIDIVPRPTFGDKAQATLTEALDAVQEIAASNPHLGQEMLRIVAERQASPASPPSVLPPDSPVLDIPAPPAASAPEPPPPPQKLLRKRKRTPPPPPPEPKSRLARHRAHCCLCGASNQDEIEEAFLDWENVSVIAEEYNVARRVIYRHAHATGLFDRRDRNVRRALGHIIHEAGHVPASADSVIRAVRLLTHINERGEFVQPPTHVVFTSAMAVAAANVAASGRAAALPNPAVVAAPAIAHTPPRALPQAANSAPDPSLQSDTSCQVKSPVTRSKQTKRGRAK